MQLLKALWALAGAALCCFLVLVIHAQFLKEGNCPRAPSLRSTGLPARSAASAAALGQDWRSATAGPEGPATESYPRSCGARCPRTSGFAGGPRGRAGGGWPRCRRTAGSAGPGGGCGAGPLPLSAGWRQRPPALRGPR